jgi:hypothetical protein
MPKMITRKPKNIIAVKIYIAFEGEKDEQEYFDLLSKKLSIRFTHIIKFVPIKRTGGKSDFTNIYNDLINYLDQENIKLSSKNARAFIVYDKDQNYSTNNIMKTKMTLRDSRQKGISCLVTAPSFELWLLLHFHDVSTLPADLSHKLLTNRMAKGRRFIKKHLKENGISTSSNELLSNLRDAIENEEKINNIYKTVDISKPKLHSSVGELFRIIRSEYNLPIEEFLN